MRLPGIGEAVGYVEGYRAWRIHLQPAIVAPLRLKSITADAIWQPGEAMTACCVDGRCGACEKKRITKGMGLQYAGNGKFPGCILVGTHHVRPITNRGIYAKKSFDGIIDSHYVYGTVALWGKVAHHTKGYRATRAYPKCLYKWPGQESIEELAEIYGCDIEPPCDELMIAYREYAHTVLPCHTNTGLGNPFLQQGPGLMAQQALTDVQQLQMAMNRHFPLLTGRNPFDLG